MTRLNKSATPKRVPRPKKNISRGWVERKKIWIFCSKNDFLVTRLKKRTETKFHMENPKIKEKIAAILFFRRHLVF